MELQLEQVVKIRNRLHLHVSNIDHRSVVQFPAGVGRRPDRSLISAGCGSQTRRCITLSTAPAKREGEPAEPGGNDLVEELGSSIKASRGSGSLCFPHSQNFPLQAKVQNLCATFLCITITTTTRTRGSKLRQHNAGVAAIGLSYSWSVNIKEVKAMPTN